MRTLVAVACLMTLFLAGCADDTPDEDDGDDGGVTVQPGTSSSGGGTSSASPTSQAPADYNVELYDSRYDPLTLAVPNYQKVVFENKGALTHTVTIVRQGDSAGTTYRDQPVQTGATVDFNFPNDGTYTVYCRYHGTETSGMHMTITV
jgi:plastocyanin